MFRNHASWQQAENDCMQYCFLLIQLLPSHPEQHEEHRLINTAIEEWPIESIQNRVKNWCLCIQDSKRGWRKQSCYLLLCKIHTKCRGRHTEGSARKRRILQNNSHLEIKKNSQKPGFGSTNANQEKIMILLQSEKRDRLDHYIWGQEINLLCTFAQCHLLGPFPSHIMMHFLCCGALTFFRRLSIQKRKQSSSWTCTTHWLQAINDEAQAVCWMKT